MPIYFLTGAFQRGAFPRGKRAFCGNSHRCRRRQDRPAWAVCDPRSGGYPQPRQSPARTFRRRLRRSCQNGSIPAANGVASFAPRVHGRCPYDVPRSRTNCCCKLRESRARGPRGSWASTWKQWFFYRRRTVHSADGAAFECREKASSEGPPLRIADIARLPKRGRVWKSAKLCTVSIARTGLHLRKPAPFSTPASHLTHLYNANARHPPPQARPHQGRDPKRKENVVAGSSATDTASTPAPCGWRTPALPVHLRISDAPALLRRRRRAVYAHGQDVFLRAALKLADGTIAEIFRQRFMNACSAPYRFGIPAEQSVLSCCHPGARDRSRCGDRLHRRPENSPVLLFDAALNRAPYLGTDRRCAKSYTIAKSIRRARLGRDRAADCVRSKGADCGVPHGLRKLCYDDTALCFPTRGNRTSKRVHEDSCMEFFFSLTDDGRYVNF